MVANPDPPPIIGRCVNCIHWTPPSHPLDHGFGVCKRVVDLEAPGHLDEQAYIDGYESHAHILTTRCTFGCTLWENKS